LSYGAVRADGNYTRRKTHVNNSATISAIPNLKRAGKM